VLSEASAELQYAKIFDVDVMKRMLEVLDDKGASKITNLGMFSGVNHNTCKRYVYLMGRFGWIRTAYDGRSTMIHLTDTGRSVLRSLFDYLRD